MIPVDSTETLQILVNAHRVLADAIAHVLTGAPAQPAIEVKEQTPPTPLPSTTQKSVRSKGRRRESNELDKRVHAILASRPGTSVAELERVLAMPDLPRSKLEWSLRRLSEKGLIVKSGKTCGARYSTADYQHTEPLSSLRVVGS